MRNVTDPVIGLSIVAGFLRPTNQPVHPEIGRQFFMGSGTNAAIHITPATARQWIQELEPIAEQDNA